MPGAPWILRSLLFVPGDRPDMIAKATRYGADALILDLEDGVAPDAKARARQTIATALERGFPQEPIILVRVNGMESGLLDDDLAIALRPRINAVCLPKCNAPEEIQAMDARLHLLEDRWGVSGGRIRLLPMIETARGVLAAPAIARGHRRVAALGFGAEDFTADIGVARTRAGGEVAYARAAVSLAAHAAGIDALDGIYADFRDADGLRADTASARTLGYTGKMLIHPAQVGTVHAAFAPSASEVEHAARIVAAFEEAQARGAGVAVVDGAMIDRPVVLRAQRILAIADRG
jgi:citrate lyase subunit beta / citryl-CoA lyase